MTDPPKGRGGSRRGRRNKLPKGLRQHPSGEYYLDYRDPQGKRIRERVGPNLKAAETILGKRKTEMAEDRYLDKRNAGRLRWEALCDRYEEWAKVHKERSYKTSVKYQLAMLRKRFEGKTLAEITPLFLDKYVAERAGEVSSSTVNRETALISHMFTKAIEWGEAESNPWKGRKKLREPSHRIRFLSLKELAVLKAKADAEMRQLITVATETGLRRGELFGLRWSEVDMENGIIHVLDTKSGKPREVPITPGVKAVLKKRKRQNQKAEVGSVYIFCGPDGKPRVDLRKRFDKALQAAKIEDFRWHDMRHTFASHLVMSGADLMTVKELLGHADLKMTMKYAHLASSHKKAAVSGFSKYLLDKGKLEKGEIGS